MDCPKESTLVTEINSDGNETLFLVFGATSNEHQWEIGIREVTSGIEDPRRLHPIDFSPLGRFRPTDAVDRYDVIFVDANGRALPGLASFKWGSETTPLRGSPIHRSTSPNEVLGFVRDVVEAEGTRKGKIYITVPPAS